MNQCRFEKMVAFGKDGQTKQPPYMKEMRSAGGLNTFMIIIDNFVLNMICNYYFEFGHIC